MDNINNCFYTWWKKDFIDGLFRVITMVLFFWKSYTEVQIPGFINIEHRRRIRAERWNARREFDEDWGDTPERREDCKINPWSYHDIFDLRRLFNMQNLTEEIAEIDMREYAERRVREEEERRMVIERLVEHARVRDEQLQRLWMHEQAAPGG